MTRTQKKVAGERMADFVRGELAPQDALNVLDAVEQDRDLSRDLDLHVELLNLARSGAAPDLLENPAASLTLRQASSLSGSWWERLLRDRRVMVPAGALLGLAVVGFVVLTILSKGANPYGDLADLGDPGSSFRMRGGSDAELVDATARLVEGDAGEAANRFERFLRMYPASEWVPWVEYAAGLSRLSNARTAVFGVVVRCDAGEVRRGLEHLDRVLGGVTVPELIEDALWYRAKGSLMLGDAASAEANLTRILGLQGSRQPAARKLLTDLHSLHQ